MPFEYVKRSGERGISQGVYLPKSLWERVNAMATLQERTRADMLRRIIKVGLDTLERRTSRTSSARPRPDGAREG